MNGLAEKYEHPEHVPVFLDFDEKTGSVYHIDRQEGRARLDYSRRKGSLLPDDEFEAIRMTFPARSDPGFSQQTATRNVAAVSLSPPPHSTVLPRQQSEGRKSPRDGPRGPRAPSRVASSAQLRVSQAPPSTRQRTKSAVNRYELRPGPASFHTMPVTPQIHEAVEIASQNVLPDNHWEGVYEQVRPQVVHDRLCLTCFARRMTLIHLRTMMSEVTQGSRVEFEAYLKSELERFQSSLFRTGGISDLYYYVFTSAFPSKLYQLDCISTSHIRSLFISTL